MSALLRVVAAVVLACTMIAVRAYGQAETLEVTDDMVNEIAHGLYCPVCPNERLDTCQTDACASWRADIRRQLEAGRTPQQIVDDFVARYGERAIGIPQDPTLYALSVYAPFIIAGLALIVGVMTFLRWRARKPAAAAPAVGTLPPDDPYRARLEDDIQG